MGAEFALRRTGPLTVSAGTAGLFARVLPGSETPDVQYHFLPFSTDKTMLELHRFPGLTISACQLRPESRGTITLASADPHVKALIHANYLATETDRRCMVEGIKLGRRLAANGCARPWSRRRSCPARRPRATRRSSPSSAAPAARSTTRAAPAAWAATRPAWWTRNCGCAGSRGCGWPMPRSCRPSSRAIPMRRRS